MKNSIIYLIVFLGIQCGVTLGVQFLWKMAKGNSDIDAMMLVVTMAAFSLVTLIVFLLAHWTKVSNEYLKTRPWGVLLWCSLAAAGAVIPSMWIQEQMPELPNALLNEFDMILRDRWGYLAVGLLAPMAEEVVFRGAILGSLLKWSKRPWLAVVISALLFSLSHGNPEQMPHAFLIGILLGWMYYRTGSIVPTITYHWVNNTIAYVSYNVMPNPDAKLVDVFGGGEHTVYLALLFSLCIFIPSILQLNLRMKRVGSK